MSYMEINLLLQLNIKCIEVSTPLLAYIQYH